MSVAAGDADRTGQGQNVIRIIEPAEAGQHVVLLDEAFRLRHRIFVEERGWNWLAQPDGRERDQVDEQGQAVHFLALEGADLTGYARMMSPDGLIPAIRTEEKLLAIAARPGIRGVGRLCVAATTRGGSKVVNPASHILVAMCEYALAHSTPELFAETDPSLLVLLRILGFRVTFIGRPMDYYGKPMQLAVIAMSQASLDICRQRLNLDGSSLLRRFGTGGR